MNDLQRRAKATKATEDMYKGKPFTWGRTCAHMLRFHARQMGHKMPTMPRFRSALTAKRALKDMGFDDLPAYLDSQFERIPPAMMRMGDVVAMPGDNDWCGILIRGSVTKYLGFHEDAQGCTVLEADIGQAIGAWRL